MTISAKRPPLDPIHVQITPVAGTINPTLFTAVQLPSNVVLSPSTSTPVRNSFVALNAAGVDHSAYVIFEGAAGTMFNGQLADWFAPPASMNF